MGLMDWIRGRKREEAPSPVRPRPERISDDKGLQDQGEMEHRSVDVLWKRRDQEIEDRLKRLEARFDTLQSQWIDILDHQQRIMGQILISNTYGSKRTDDSLRPAWTDIEASEQMVGPDPDDIINGIDIDRGLTLSNFLTDETNRFAFMAAKGATEKMGSKYNPLLIIGPAGTGKSHLLNGIGSSILERDGEKNVLFTNPGYIMEDLKRGEASGSTSKIRNRYLEVDVLLIDDLQSGPFPQWAVNQLRLIVEGILRKGGMICSASSREISTIEGIGRDLGSRLEGGVKVHLKIPGFEGRRQILADMVKNEGIAVTTEVLDYLAMSLDQNVREMQGNFSRLCAYSDLMREPISISMIKTVLEDLPEQGEVMEPARAEDMEDDMVGALLPFSDEAADPKEDDDIDMDSETTALEEELLLELKKEKGEL